MNKLLKKILTFAFGILRISKPTHCAFRFMFGLYSSLSTSNVTTIFILGCCSTAGRDNKVEGLHTWYPKATVTKHYNQPRLPATSVWG